MFISVKVTFIVFPRNSSIVLTIQKLFAIFRKKFIVMSSWCLHCTFKAMFGIFHNSFNIKTCCSKIYVNESPYMITPQSLTVTYSPTAETSIQIYRGLCNKHQKTILPLRKNSTNCTAKWAAPSNCARYAPKTIRTLELNPADTCSVHLACRPGK